jgi:hypothetical protein
MNIRRILMNESEKSRILSLHENLRVINSNLIMEQDIDAITKYFEEQKKKYSDFPDGKVVPITGGGFGYQTNNGIILYPDGTAYNANGIKAVEKWTDEPYVIGSTTQGAADSMPTGTPAQGTPAQGTPAQGTPAQGTPSQGTPKTVSFDDLASDKDLRQGNRKDAIAKRKTGRQEQRDRKTRVENCTTAINNYTTYKLDSKPDTDPDKVKYVTFLKTNCTDLDEIDLTMVGL